MTEPHEAREPREGSWDRTAAAIYALPELTGAKPEYVKPGHESWAATYYAVQAIQTAEPKRTVKTRAQAGVEPVPTRPPTRTAATLRFPTTLTELRESVSGLPGALRVARRRNDEGETGYTIRIARKDLDLYVARLMHCENHAKYHGAAVDARRHLWNAAMRTPAKSPYIEFRVTDSHMWTLIAIPNFEDWLYKQDLPDLPERDTDAG